MLAFGLAQGKVLGSSWERRSCQYCGKSGATLEFADLRKKAYINVRAPQARILSILDVTEDSVKWHHRWIGKNHAERLAELCSFLPFGLQVSFGNSENCVNVTVSAGNFGSLLRKRLPKFLNSKV
jgi:hypothetical protein